MHLVVGAVQDRLLRPGRQLLPRGVEVEADRVAERLRAAAGSTRWSARSAHGAIAPSPQALLRVGDDQLRVDLLAGAEAGALRAGAERRVERERARLELVDRERVVVGAGQALGEAPLAVRVVLGQVDEVEDDQAAGQAERGLDRVGEPLLGASP